MHQVTHSSLRSLSSGELCGFEFGLDGSPYIEVSCLRVTDLSITKIYIEIRADSRGTERQLTSELEDVFRPHVVDAIEHLRSVYGNLPTVFLTEQSDGWPRSSDDWIYL